MTGMGAGARAAAGSGRGTGVGTIAAVGSDALGRDPRLETDSSYREILGERAWARLRPEIRARFSVKPKPGCRQHYVGAMNEVALSFVGWLFAQCCRLIGTPLAPYRGTNVPMGIRLEWNGVLGGVDWIRGYNFPGRSRLDVRSTKLRSGPRELTEYIGCGFFMRLRLEERGGDLYFVSHAYELSLLGRTLRIPALLTPGHTTVTHEQIAGERFRFTLAVDHPWFGRTVYQEGEFRAARVLRRRRIDVVREEAERRPGRPIEQQEDRPRDQERQRIRQHHRRNGADTGGRDVALCVDDD